MTQGQPSLLDDMGYAASGAGSEALAAIKNVGGSDAGGTVGRLVSAVTGRYGGFAPKRITSVTKHGIAGVESLESVDRGYRAVAADANGLESIRTIVELDPREYDVTVTRDESAGVVEFVQQPEPAPETEAVEPSRPVKESGSTEAAAGTSRPAASAGRRTTAGGASVRTTGGRHDDVAEARAEAEKAKAEAEAEETRAEAETDRAEAEAAKALAHTERARAESRTGEPLPDTSEADVGSRSPAISQSDGGVAARERTTTTGAGAPSRPRPSSPRSLAGAATPSTSPTWTRYRLDPGRRGRLVPGRERRRVAAARERRAGARGRHRAGEPRRDRTRRVDADRHRGVGHHEGKWGLPDDAGASSVSSATADEPAAEDAVTSPSAPLRIEEPLETETVDEGTGGEATVVDDEFDSFVTADPVTDEGGGSRPEATNRLQSRVPMRSRRTGDRSVGWGDDSESPETGGFEF